MAIDQALKVLALVTLENFQGWGQGEDWSDVGLLINNGNDIAESNVLFESTPHDGGRWVLLDVKCG
jgi:hypothetical protein